MENLFVDPELAKKLPSWLRDSLVDLEMKDIVLLNPPDKSETGNFEDKDGENNKEEQRTNQEQQEKQEKQDQSIEKDSSNEEKKKYSNPFFTYSPVSNDCPRATQEEA